MAVEEDDIRERQVWTETSRSWYQKAADLDSTAGRLYHHLAILARPDAVRQLLYYVKSQCVPIPLTATAESILTMINPILSSADTKGHAIEIAFVKAVGILYYESYMKVLPLKAGSKPITPESPYEQAKAEFLGLLECRRHDYGGEMAMVLCCSVIQYGVMEANGQRYANVILNSLVPEPMSGIKPNEKANKVL